jgi:hypothetical protein
MLMGGVAVAPSTANEPRETTTSDSDDETADRKPRSWTAEVGVEPVQPEPPPGDGTADRPYQVPRATTPIKVDGELDEPAWLDALLIELPYEFWPADNTPAAVRTQALVTYDDRALYVGWRAFDPEPDKILAHLSDRDHIERDDQLGIEIDTFNDERRSYSIFINPLGVQEDAVAMANGHFDFSWDAIWDAATSFHHWGYSAEMEIPFSSIRFQRSNGPQVWGFNALRAHVRDKRYQLGAVPIDRNNSCRHCQLLKIEGFEGVSPGRNIELIPAVTMLASEQRPDFPDGGMESQGQELEFALTTHWGFTPNLTLSGTINPDFSQVEADALELDVNQPFAIFYPEKRPFFSEGADFFETEMDIVHTRTMFDPDWGIKLSGKEGRHTLGSYVVGDAVTKLLFPGLNRSAGTTLEQANTSAIFRYALDFGSRYTVGTLVTGREGTGYSNLVGGIDARLRIAEPDTITLQAMTSSTRYPDDLAEDFHQPVGEFDDTAFFVNYQHMTRSLGWDASYRKLGDGFRADLGFIPQVGFERADAALWYWWIAEPGKWWSRFRVGGDVISADDEAGGLLHEDAGLWFNYQGTLHSWVFIEGRTGREGYAGREFDIDTYVVNGSFRPMGNLELRLDTKFGDQVDYRNVRLGDRTRVTARANWNATRHLALSLNSTFERMDVAGERYYDAGISEATIAYQFSVRTYLRAILQYVDYDYAQPSVAKIIVPPDDRQLFTQLLYSYKLNPRSVLFVGYTENSLGDDELSLTEADRTLFVKVGYSWSF